MKKQGQISPPVKELKKKIFSICHSPRSLLLHFSVNHFLTSALSCPGQNDPVPAVDLPAPVLASSLLSEQLFVSAFLGKNRNIVPGAPLCSQFGKCLLIYAFEQNIKRFALLELWLVKMRSCIYIVL